MAMKMGTMRSFCWVGWALLGLRSWVTAGEQGSLHGVSRVEVLGDSIIQSGQYGAYLAQAAAVKTGGGPLDAEGRPLIRKLGTIDLDMVETTPVVFRGRLYRFEWVRAGYWNNPSGKNHFRFVDHETGKPTAPFADDHEFGSAYVEGDTVYVTGTHGRHEINFFVSTNLKDWESRPVFTEPGYGIFNTSLCKSDRDYVLMFEIDRPAEEAGAAFTARFLRSQDLLTWQLTPPACSYAKDRYTAPHCLRWLEGWFP